MEGKLWLARWWAPSRADGMMVLGRTAGVGLAPWTSQGFPEKQNPWETFPRLRTWKFITRDWLPGSRKLKSSTASCLQAGDPGRRLVQFKGLRAGELGASVPAPGWRPGPRCTGREKMDVPAQQQGRGRAKPHCVRLFKSYVRPSEDRVMPTHHGRASHCSRLSIQMLISSGNTFTDTPSNNAEAHTRVSRDPLELTHEINSQDTPNGFWCQDWGWTPRCTESFCSAP